MKINGNKDFFTGDLKTTSWSKCGLWLRWTKSFAMVVKSCFALMRPWIVKVLMRGSRGKM